MDVSKLQEKKAALEEELQRTERQIYDLEGEYLQVRAAPGPAAGPSDRGLRKGGTTERPRGSCATPAPRLSRR